MMNNKTISKWFSMLLLMLVAGITGAAAESLSISDFSIKAGERKTVAITLTAENAIYGVQTDMELCEGLTLKSASAVNKQLHFAKNTLISSGNIRMSLLSLGGDVISAGDIITLTLIASKDFESGTIRLLNSRVTTSTAGAEGTIPNSTTMVRNLPVPFVPEKDEFSGASVTSLSTFVPSSTTYTLELTGCVAEQEITVPGGSFSYTPSVDGTVRFVRNGGDEVYVYEEGVFKGTVDVSEPAAPTFPTGLTSASMENLIQNGGFEDTSAGLYPGKSDRWYPTNWTPYNKNKGTPDDGVSVRNGSPITGTYAMMMHDKGFYLTQQLSSGVMKNCTPYQITYKYKANNDSQQGQKYKFQVGSEEFKTDYFNSSETNATTTSVQDFSATFTTPASVVDQPYIQIYRSANGSGSQHLDYVDEFILVAANGGGIGITGAEGATYLDGTAYAPEGAYENGSTASLDNPTLTDFVTNGTFDSNRNGWTTTTGASSNKVTDNQTGAFTGNFWENWNSDSYTGKMYQEVTDVPNGTYKLNICAFVNNVDANKGQYVYANDNKSYVYTTTPTAYTVYTYVTNHTLEYGLEQSTAVANWMGIDNVSLEYCGAADVTVEGFEAIYEAMTNHLDDRDYANVSGNERTVLQNAVNAEPTPTVDGYATATFDIGYADFVFMKSKDSYDAFRAACTEGSSYTTELWPYAAESKDNALNAAIAVEPTDGEDALSKAAAIETAYRQFVESNGVAEGVNVAVDFTSSIQNADCASSAGWTITSTSGQGLSVKSESEQKYTMGNGELSGNYLDGGWASNAGCNQTASQVFSLPEGKYLLQITARSNVDTYTMSISDGEDLNESVDLPRDGSVGGTFGKGWSDKYVEFQHSGEHDLTLTIHGESSNNGTWMSFNRIRLTKLDATLANADDYAALNAAIEAAEAKTLGFQDGEYAPYENIEAMALLAAAKEIDPNANNIQSKVQTATAVLNDAWKENDGEVNAIWDPSFEYDYSIEGIVQPIAWTGTNGHDNATDVRWQWNVGANAGLAATSSSKALFTKYGVYYGKQEGYTLPLHAETYYTIGFKYGGWNDCKKDGYVKMTDPDEASIKVVPSADLPLDAVDANSNVDSWKIYTGYFKTNEAGNYVMELRKKDETKQSQYVYGDFVLKTTTLAEATDYYNHVLDEVDDDYDAEAIGASEKAAFSEALSVDISGMTVTEIMDAAANLYALRDAFVAAIPKYNALEAINTLIASVGDLAYADPDKKPSATVSATSAEDAEEKIASQTQALRAYYESNAMAEGVVGHLDKTDAVSAANADTNTGWTNGIGTNSGQGYIDADGVKAEKYLDGGWSASAGVNIDMTREVDVPAGKYLLTVTARGAVDLTEYLMKIGDESVELPHIGNVGGVFDNGWNDVSVEFESYGAPLTLEIKATSTEKQQWISLNRFRLVRIGESEDSKIVDEANALAADDDAVAVGKLHEAIDAYNNDGELSALSRAVAQFKLDNADQEKDETAKVATNGWKKFEGNDPAGICATQFAPAIDTYDGRKNVQMAEVYEETCATTGQIIYQNISGLADGTYKVGFYANAFSTAKRDTNIPCDLPDDGADDVAYVFANDEKAFVNAIYATSTTENSFRSFEIEVTGGTIKLGMGKEKAGTNWHIIQIYQLTWFTTAKAVYAKDKQEMQALIAKAEALLANEYKTEGRDALSEAIGAASDALTSNKLNIEEFETEIQALRDAIETFSAANYVTMEGTYYVQNVTLGKYMAAGHDYGTRGIVNVTGLDMTLAPDEDKKVTFDSYVSNGSTKHYLGINLYMDSDSYGWIIEQVSEDGYSISDGSQFLGVDENDNLVLQNTASEWKFIEAEDMMTIRLATLDEATAENGVDATFLLKNPNFNRNDLRVSAWVVSDNCTNKNLNGGNEVNNCAESYHSLFTISQTVEGARAGIYTMTAQGFYRQDPDGDKNVITEDAPVFFAGNKTAKVPVRTGDESSMGAASESFSVGKYTIDPIQFIVGEDGKLTVGIKNESALYQWVIFDNFQLTYYGPAPETTVPMAISAAKYATFVAPFNVEIPKNVTAYTVDGANDENELQMTVVADIIPANTPVVLFSETEVDIEVKGVADAEETPMEGWLVGTYKQIDAPVGSYVLQNHEGNVAFYKVYESPIPPVPANRAYLSVTTSEEARVFYLNGEATAIKAIEALTVGEAEIYDVNGRRQVKLQKGVNIIRTKDGRTNKVMVK